LKVGQFKKVIGTVQRISLTELLSVDERELHARDEKTFSLFYAESYYLNHYLDSGERRARFRSLIREVAHMPRAFLPTRLAARVRELFGDLGALERGLEASLRAEPKPFWISLGGDVRPFAPDAVAISSGRGGSGVALPASNKSTFTRFRATVEDIDADAVDLLFVAHPSKKGFSYPNDFCRIAFSRDAPTVLQCWRGHWETVVEGSPTQSGAGARTLGLDFKDGHVRASVDGEALLEGTPPGEPTTTLAAGIAAVGVRNGRASFRDVNAQ
jgi:hypothetical protein